MRQDTFRPMAWGSVRLLPGELQRRDDLGRAYMIEPEELKTCCRTTTWRPAYGAPRTHTVGTVTGAGSRRPASCAGHFLGHWLSAAAKRYAATGDQRAQG